MGIETSSYVGMIKSLLGSCTLAIWVLKLFDSVVIVIVGGSCTLAIWVLKRLLFAEVYHLSVLVRSLYGY